MDWAQEAERHVDGHARQETLVDGLKTVVEYKDEVFEEGNKRISRTYKVTSQYKTVTKRVPKIVAQRKKWKKFGASVNSKAGVDSSTTNLGDEVKTTWICTSSGDTILGDDNTDTFVADKAGGGAHCRYCKSKDHWSVQCPHKDQLDIKEDEAEEEVNAGGGTTVGGKYIPPSQRGGAMPALTMDRRPGDENTLRISNLPQHTEEDDLKALIMEKMRETNPTTASPMAIRRLFLARNKLTRECRGYAFVTFDLGSVAEQTLEALNRCMFEHCVLQVMGLLTIVRKLREKEREMRILIVGLDNGGKTTTVCSLNGEDVDGIEPTLGFNIVTLTHGQYKLNVWDVGGQKSLRSYWRNYFSSTEGVIWVVDAADRRRLADCKAELDKLLVDERLLGASLLVYANKQDLPGALSPREIEEYLNIEGRSHHCRVFPCSAREPPTLLAGIDWLVDDLSQRLFDSH